MNDLVAPPPLEPLRTEIISAGNQAVLARQAKAETIGWGKRWQYKKKLKQLKHHFNDAEYQVLASKREDLQLAFMGASTKEERQLARDEWGRHSTQYKILHKQFTSLKQIELALTNHDLAVVREKRMKKLESELSQEAKIYEQIIIDKWSRLGFKHTYQKGTKWRTDKVKFERIVIAMDAIYYKIAASYGTAFGGYKTDMPDGVYITKHLLEPGTISELTIACQRQVTGEYGTNGAWLIVHRLEAIDGLLNHVTYQDAISQYPARIHSKMPICVGVGLNRTTQWVKMTEYPHWLIGGYTKSGKSNLVNVLLCTLISKHEPKDLRLALIDLKGGLEFNYYEGIPHLMGEIVDDISGVAKKLEELEYIMKDRFIRIKGIAKEIETYRERRPNDHMPYVFCVFDEVASIMAHGETTKEIHNHLRTLTRMGRAVGIHIILCTQRPDVKAIDGAIKANLTLRISGRMSTSTDSITVLGSGAAKDLAPLPGRMVMQLGADPEPVQTPHITDEDIQDALALARAMKPAPELVNVVIEKVPEWDEQRIIHIAIEHMEGYLSAERIYKAWAADGNLSVKQAYKLVENVRKLGRIVHQDITYKPVKNGRGWVLKPDPSNQRIQQDDIPLIAEQIQSVDSIMESAS